MEYLKVKVGDRVELFGGLFGYISSINSYSIEINSCGNNLGWFHVSSIKYLNNVYYLRYFDIKEIRKEKLDEIF